MIIILLNILTTVTVTIFTAILIIIVVVNAIIIIIIIIIIFNVTNNFRDAFQFYSLAGPTSPFLLMWLAWLKQNCFLMD